MTKEYIEQKKDSLRELWKLYPDRRPIIEKQAMLLNKALKIIENKEPPQKPLLQE